jgi:two-component system, cell cycle response regulator
VTLRGRLTAAFLAIVLGPVLLGALLVGQTAAASDRDRALARLDLAAASIRTSVSALCQQLFAAADAIAVGAEPAARAATAGQVVARGLGRAVRITDAGGASVYATPDWPAPPWADCAGSGTSDTPPSALAARVELRDKAGAVAGAVAVAQVLDGDLVARLSSATGVGVTLLGTGVPPSGLLSTEPAAVRGNVAATATGLTGDRVASADGRYVRRAGPSPGQPLPLAVSVPGEPPRGLFALIGLAVVVAALLAVLAARQLANSTTRPLAQLGYAADRVAAGDLSARVPARSNDEVGRLAAAFNRMARETQAYVQALTAGRDQLRGQLAILGDTLSSTHDLPRILKVILQTALVSTGARAGAIALPDQTTGLLVGHYAEREGRDGAGPVVVPLRAPVGSGLLGGVAASGAARRGRLDRDRGELAADEPSCTAYLAVPVATDGTPVGDGPAPVGVLALYDPLGSAAFEDDDQVTLQAFARHAAVAVNNVRQHEETQRLSLTDPLTGLWNYRSLQESLHREVERASRFGRMLCVLVLDLDRFKEINDNYGHPAGDIVLAEFARRIRRALREVDLAFRQGGEEFAVLLPETDAFGGETVAQRLGDAVRTTPIRLDPPGDEAGASVSVTVSIGVAVYPDHGATAQHVLDAADAALYAAKAAGRDTYRLARLVPDPTRQEMVVGAAAASPDDGMPWAGRPDGGRVDRPDGGQVGRPGGGTAPGDATSGSHPPRQSRGR